jgi:hypothetical protein
MMKMKTISTEDRARYFMAYGCHSEQPEILVEFIVWDQRLDEEVIRNIYADKIVEAAKSYVDDLAFACDSPKVAGKSHSKLEQEIFEELSELSETTLRVLAAVIVAKVGAN